MGLGHDDKIPTSISLSDAYSKVRQWYQVNVAKAEVRGDAYGRRSAALIQALPLVGATSDLEKRAVFQEVISGLLEWGYHESDGDYKMAAYAHAATKAAQLSWSLSNDEKNQLRQSRLWPFLSYA